MGKNKMKVRWFKIIWRLVYFLFLIISFTSCSRYEQIEVGEVINITNDNQAYSVSSISVNPINSKNMVVAVMRWEDLTEGQLKYNVTTYITDDAGASWKESILPKTEGQGSSIGASVLYSKTGRVYISYSARIPDRRRTAVILHSSDDNGRTWSNATIINTVYNEIPKLTIDQSENIYISTYGLARDSLLNIEDPVARWALILGKSTDSGKTFDLRGITFDNDLNLGAFTLASFSDGALWFPFTQFNARDTTGNIHASISGTRIFKNEIKMESIDKVVTTKRKIAYMVNIAVDESEHFKDRLYMTYSTGTKDSLQTALIYSEDKGRSWSEPYILMAPNKGYFSRLPKVSVSSDGIVGVSWVQTESRKNQCWKVYFSYSKDGGDSFSEPIAISSKISCPDNNEVLGIGNGLLSKYYTYGGDYMGLSSAENGFQAAWVDMSNDNFQLYTTKINLPRKEH